jgi:hypothetical protein
VRLAQNAHFIATPSNEDGICEKEGVSHMDLDSARKYSKHTTSCPTVSSLRSSFRLCSRLSSSSALRSRERVATPLAARTAENVLNWGYSGAFLREMDQSSGCLQMQTVRGANVQAVRNRKQSSRLPPDFSAARTDGLQRDVEGVYDCVSDINGLDVGLSNMPLDVPLIA